jgi:nucleoside-diphosphate-sugar epimerase
MSRDLIIGARGLVGSALAKRIPDALLGISVEPKEKNQVYTDVAKYETLLRVFSTYRPKTVYLAGLSKSYGYVNPLRANSYTSHRVMYSMEKRRSLTPRWM